jgi:ribosome-binding factor A
MIGGMLRDLLSSLLREEARDPRLSLVTVTEVEVTRDLSHARVFVSKLGTDAERQAAVKALNHAAPYFRREIARRTRLRRAPELVFVEDAALQGGFRITRLLDEIRGEQPESDAPKPGADEPS